MLSKKWKNCGIEVNMPIRNEFEDREWKLVSSLPAWAAMGILAVEGGIINYIRGLAEIGKMLETFHKEFGESPLVLEILADYNQKSGGQNPPEPLAQTDEDIYQVEESDTGEYRQSISEMNIMSGKPFPMSELLQKCRQAVFITESRAGIKESNAFKQLIVRIAEIMAGASGLGFLGIGEKISKREAEAITNIKKALNYEQA
jgi:hypothetical protein